MTDGAGETSGTRMTTTPCFAESIASTGIGLTSSTGDERNASSATAQAAVGAKREQRRRDA